MRRLTGLAIAAYPREWRSRYGVELQCLLEDSSRHGAARLRDVFDILKGGLIVRYTGTNVVRMAATWGLSCGLLGLLIFGAVALAMPDRYQAETMLVGRVRGPQDGAVYLPASQEKMVDVVNRAMNDEALARLIGLYGLYGYQPVPDRPYRWGQDPAQDIAVSARVAEFRRDIRVGFFDPTMTTTRQVKPMVWWWSGTAVVLLGRSRK